jgi:hypothetical protein
MKSVIKSKLSDYLLQNQLLTPNQHGFLAKRSTCIQFMECTYDWTVALNVRNSADVVFIDLNKTSDSVCHSKLIIKLQSMGIGGKVLAWISSYYQIESK